VHRDENRETLVGRLALRVDRALSDRVVVYGSLPPKGRDLDLLARPPEAHSIAEELTAAGLERLRGEWFAFADCTAAGIDVVPAADWGLPADELHALFEEARPIDGFKWLVRPSPAHTLLIVARVGFAEKRRDRVARALAEDPYAWDGAARRAAAWRQSRRLERLRAAYGAGPRRRPRRPRAVSVVAFSGLDGAGKSAQALELRTALRQLGRDAEVIWMPFGNNPSVQALSASARRALRLGGALGPIGRLDRATAAGESLVAVPATGARPSTPPALVAHVWVGVVALANALAHRRAVLRHAASGRVVIFDRYTLDSIVRLRFLYGHARDLRLQRWLIEALSPRAARSFLLDVPPAVALQRKQDQWTLADLSRQHELYAAEAARLGVRRVDGTRPMAEVCAEIARDVWKELG
jgi:thymidylate kinase